MTALRSRCGHSILRLWFLLSSSSSLLGEASPSIGNTLWRVSTMFTRPATTPSEVNGFGWNLEHSEYIVRSWPWQIMCAIPVKARAGQRAEILFFCLVNNARLYRFPVSQNLRNLHTRRRNECFRNRILKIFRQGVVFSKKANFGQKSSTTSDLSPWYLRNDYKSRKLTTNWDVDFPFLPLEST